MRSSSFKLGLITCGTMRGKRSVRTAFDGEAFGFGGSEAGLEVADGGAQVAEFLEGEAG